jgi:hypothetical protein
MLGCVVKRETSIMPMTQGTPANHENPPSPPFNKGGLEGIFFITLKANLCEAYSELQIG